MINLDLPTTGEMPYGAKLNAALTALNAAASRNDLGVYVPPGWGSFWLPKLNGAASGKAVIAVTGDGVAQGFYASNLRGTGFVDRVRASLQTTYGDGGSGFIGSTLTSAFLTARGVPTAAVNAYATAGNLYSLIGTWSGENNSAGPGGYGFSTVASGAKYSVSARGTVLKVYTLSGGGTHANWSYKVDGGSTVNVTDSGTGSESIQVTTISGLASGTHSLEITYAGTSGRRLHVIGVAGEYATGVVVNNLSRLATRSENWAGTSNLAMTAAWNGGPSYPADLLVLAHGPGDALNRDSGDLWAKNLHRIISTARDSGAADGSTELLIVLPHIGKADYDADGYYYQHYSTRARGLAESTGAALVNFWTRGRNSWAHWNSLGHWANPAVPGSAGTDTLYPSNTGHQAMADLLLPIIKGQPI